MNGFMDGLAAVAVPMAGLGVLLMLLCTVTYIWEQITGDAELPKLKRKKKSPRRVAAQRGEVGRKVRRTKYEYIEIIPDFGGSVKGLRVRRVRR